MPGYVEAALASFQHTCAPKPQHSSHLSAVPNYGKYMQLMEEEDTSDPLSTTYITRVHWVISKTYYHTRAVDHTILCALGKLTTQQTAYKATKRVVYKILWLLNYAATHPSEKVRYYASWMILHVDSGASYLSVRNARSRVGISS